MISFVEAIKDRLQGKAPKGAKRSRGWPKARRKHKKLFPYCAICGRKKKVQVHHVVPFHFAPELELDPKNFRSLCENKKNGIACHMLIGHLGNFKKVNTSVDADILYWRQKLGVFYKNSGLEEPLGLY